MKNKIKFLATFMMILIAAIAVQAQGGRGPGRPGDFDPEKAAERQTGNMTEKLSLSEEQAAQIEVINLKYARKLDEIRKQEEEEREKMRETVKGIRDEQQEELKGVLTDEQFAEWETIIAERREDRRGQGRKSRKDRRD